VVPSGRYRGTVTPMVHLSRAAHGGLAIGVGAFGSAVWAQREPQRRRWSVWRTRVPKKPASSGDDWGFGATGVREPRRPLPGRGGNTVALDRRLMS
jgi:hypothetical protein